jgi:hypothetical protein
VEVHSSHNLSSYEAIRGIPSSNWLFIQTIEELLDVSVPSVVTTVFNQEEKLVKALNLDFKHISPYGYLSALHTTSNLSEEVFTSTNTGKSSLQLSIGAMAIRQCNDGR